MLDICKAMVNLFNKLVQDTSSAPGWGFFYSGTTGDLAFLKDVFPELNNYLMNDCCMFCAASKKPGGDPSMSSTNFRLDAKHISSKAS